MKFITLDEQYVVEQIEPNVFLVCRDRPDTTYEYKVRIEQAGNYCNVALVNTPISCRLWAFEEYRELIDFAIKLANLIAPTFWERAQVNLEAINILRPYSEQEINQRYPRIELKLRKQT